MEPREINASVKPITIIFQHLKEEVKICMIKLCTKHEYMFFLCNKNNKKRTKILIFKILKKVKNESKKTFYPCSVCIFFVKAF